MPHFKRDPHGLVPGSIVGPWRVLERVDFGSNGVVYRAQRVGHPASPPVALKMARRPWEARFEREAEILRRCPHPNVPRFEGEGLWMGPNGQPYPYIVMEWVEGLTLYEWLAAARSTSRDVLRLLSQVASALAASHAQGAIHRDVKGDNIRVTAEGRAVLLDWGSGWIDGARPLTDNIVPPGTRPYRPPEQRAFMWHFRMDEEARWESTPSDDLYSLGVTFYRAVTGRYPSPWAAGGEPVERKVVRPGDMATVCGELETIILRLLSHEREERGTAEQLAQEAQVAADTAGPEADRPIVPTVRARPIEKAKRYTFTPEEGRHPRHGPVVPAWLFLSSLAVMAVLLVMVATAPRRSHPVEPEPLPVPVAEEWHVPEVEAPDGGVGDVALLSVIRAPRPVHAYAMALPMPKSPYPGQKKPPCDLDYEIAALGACWFVSGKKPPCGSGAYEYAGKCIRASFDAPRDPTSGEP